MTKATRAPGAGWLAFLFLAFVSPAAAQETPAPYSMPSLFPLYAPPPVRFHDNRILTVVFRTTPETLQALVPKPMRPNPYNLMFVYYGRLAVESPAGGAFEYLEAGIGVPVVFENAPGYHPVCLYLDKAYPIVAGREIWGWPKKDAAMTFSEKDGEVSARVERFGAVLVEMSAKLEKKIDPALKQPELPWYLLKIVPSARKGAPPDVWQLISSKNVDVATNELWSCAATVKLGAGPADDLAKIKVLGVVSAQFSVGDFTMDYGEVLYDYLAKK